MNFNEMKDIAIQTLNPRKLSRSSYAGTVAAVIMSESGTLYKGVCIDTPSSMGFCAEHAAIGAMITNGESKIIKMLAVNRSGSLIPPCGRCREFVSQIHDENMACQILVAEDTVVTLSNLLPFGFNLENSDSAED